MSTDNRIEAPSPERLAALVDKLERCVDKLERFFAVVGMAARSVDEGVQLAPRPGRTPEEWEAMLDGVFDEPPPRQPQAQQAPSVAAAPQATAPVVVAAPTQAPPAKPPTQAPGGTITSGLTRRAERQARIESLTWAYHFDPKSGLWHGHRSDGALRVSGVSEEEAMKEARALS